MRNMQVCDEWFCSLSLGDGFHFIDYLGVLLLSIVCFSVILNFLIAFGYMTWVVLTGANNEQVYPNSTRKGQIT